MKIHPTLANHFFIHSQHAEKEGWQERMELKLRYHNQYHHNHPPPPLLPNSYRWKGGGGKKGERTSENSVTLMLIWKTETERLTINIVGWHFSQLVWNRPSSSRGKAPGHLEKSKREDQLNSRELINFNITTTTTTTTIFSNNS